MMECGKSEKTHQVWDGELLVWITAVSLHSCKAQVSHETFHPLEGNISQGYCSQCSPGLTHILQYSLRYPIRGGHRDCKVALIFPVAAFWDAPESRETTSPENLLQKQWWWRMIKWCSFWGLLTRDMTKRKLAPTNSLPNNGLFISQHSARPLPMVNAEVSLGRG